MKIKYKKLNRESVPPSFATSHSAGLDLCSSKKIVVKAGEVTLIPTGIAVEIPVGNVGFLALRSSTPKKKGLFSPHGMGVIDSDYRGELFVQVCTLKQEDVIIEAGDRIAQLVITPSRVVVKNDSEFFIKGVQEVESLSETKRGSGGFGSTGN